MQILLQLLLILLISSLANLDARAEIKIENIVNNNSSTNPINSELNSGGSSSSIPTQQPVNDSGVSSSDSSNSNIDNNYNNNSGSLIIDDQFNLNPLPKNSSPLNKSPRSNNLGMSLSFGKKFYWMTTNKLELPHNFIISEFFVMNNLLKSKYGAISSASGFRVGIGRDFNKFNLIFNVNVAQLSLSDPAISKWLDNSSPQLNFGLSCGYYLSKLLALRLNLMTSLGKPVIIDSNFSKFAFNNLDLGLAFNF